MVDLFAVCQKRDESLEYLELYLNSLREHRPNCLQYERDRDLVAIVD